MREIKINEKYNEKKLNTVILKEFPKLTLNALNKALRKKDIRINNTRVSTNEIVHTGDIISIYIIDDILLGNSNLNFESWIIYEDNNILIINKPQGICVTKDYPNEISLEELTKQYAKDNYSPMPTHRLDRNTMGLVIFSKNNNSLNELLELFKNRQIQKFYQCLVYGYPERSSALLEDYLFKDAKNNIVNISNKPLPGYEKILTKYTVTETRKNNTSVLEVELLTGKTHQIRAHLASIGHPIIGDGKYGIGEVNKKFNLASQQLCAYKLIFHTDNCTTLKYLNNKEFKIKCSF